MGKLVLEITELHNQCQNVFGLEKFNYMRVKNWDSCR